MFLFAFAGTAAAQSYPLPVSVDTANTGRYIQRTMHLLASSTPQHKNTVKILVYGQSISEQKWWLEVKRDLTARFPNANLLMENRSIGGFSSSLLVKTTEMDVSSFYPDLVLFHVYGDTDNYESILKIIRSRTTAEIALQTDHYNKADDWSDKVSYSILPELAKKYKCELLNIRAGWKRYLDDNKYTPSKLLSDEVHLNDHGNFLMAELIKPYLFYKPQYDSDEFKLMTIYKIGRDVFFKGNKLILPVAGNKVEVVAGNLISTSKPAKVLVDGKKPSSFQGTYFATRPYGDGKYGWPWSLPGMIHVGHEMPWKKEEWTCRFTEVTPPYNDFAFEISGSKTGKDGSGTSLQDFISNSKRVIIKKGDAEKGGDWHLHRSYQVVKSTVNRGDEIKWNTYSIGTDVYAPEAGPRTSSDNVTILFQGIPNTKHVLILKGKKKYMPVTEIRVYKPFLQDQLR